MLAAVANARCVGLIMETDSNRQPNKERRSVYDVCFLMRVVLKIWLYRAKGKHTCGFTGVREISGIIYEQVGSEGIQPIHIQSLHIL